MLSEARLNSCDLIVSTGGLSHIMAAMQKSFALNDIDTTNYSLKALTNLTNYRNPILKLLVVEMGYLEIVIE